MATSKTKRGTEKRTELIRIGVARLTEKGFHNLSLDEIVTIAGIPKGSFHYYFGSKDSYAFEVIDAYGVYFARKLERRLGDPSHAPLDRIRLFIEDSCAGMEKYGFKRGCLVGNLSQELAGLDDNFRERLLEVQRDWRRRFKACLDEAKEQGAIRADADTVFLARYFWSVWEGAVMTSKLERSRLALEEAGQAFIDSIRVEPPGKFQALTCPTGRVAGATPV